MHYTCTESTMMESDWRRTADDNLTSLVELDEKTLLENVRRRYQTGRVYTDVGDILLAVNPFKQLSIYTDQWSELYSTSIIDDKAPHIFGVAAKAFAALLQTKKDQVCVISGESGAGKTESTKLIIHQLMKICKSSHIGTQLQQKILQLNPVLEAFGNAKTLLNNNSSRFGKFIQLMFTASGRIAGGGLDQYLLEKSRVCFQGEEELNYHIFYYLLDGIDSIMAKELHINTSTLYRYTGAVSNSTRATENKSRLQEVTGSMKEIGFTSDEINQVFTTLAAILHMGDIAFKSTECSSEGSQIVNKDKVEIVSKLLKLEHPDDLSFALTTLRTTTRGETVDKLYSPSKACDVRDAISKALYSRMFHWLVSRINNYIAPKDPDGSYIGIGILDIFGFETFKKNSFEQFCINVANEQLQQYFNTQIFAMEKEEYIKEGVTGVDISYQDNQPLLQLFLSRPIGLMSLLDEQCRTNGNESRLLDRYRQCFNKHPDYIPDRGSALAFCVQHYAGKVEYCAEGFIDKNRDSLPEPVLGVMKFSGHRLVRNLFTHYPNLSGSVLRTNTRLKPSQRTILKKMSVRKKSTRRGRKGVAGGRAGGRRKVMTVSGDFRESLQKLMERILSATPHFIRCFKPNPLKVPFKFESDFVAKQLKYTGMLEAIRVRREGFAYRPFFSDFVHDYKSIAFKMTDKAILHSSQDVCEKILHVAGITGWKIGKSRVFLRYFHEEKLNRMLLEMETKAIKIQSFYRSYYTRKSLKPLFEMAKREQSIVNALLKDIHEHTEDSFTRIVQLNKIDILLAVERFGHPNQGCDEDQLMVKESEQEPKGKRKFKPKAVGGVSILMDMQPPVEQLSSKGGKSSGGVPIEETRNNELFSPTKQQKKIPLQPRKLSREHSKDNLIDMQAFFENLSSNGNKSTSIEEAQVTKQRNKTPPVQPRKLSRELSKDNLIDMLSSKGNQSTSAAKSIEEVQTTKQQKKIPPVQPRKLNMEQIENKLSGKSTPEKPLKPPITARTKIAAKEVKVTHVENQSNESSASPTDPIPVYALPNKKKFPPSVSPKPKPRKKPPSDSGNPEDEEGIRPSPTHMESKHTTSREITKELLRPVNKKPIIERENSTEYDYMDMSGEFSTLDLPFKRRPSLPILDTVSGDKPRSSTDKLPSPEYIETFANGGLDSVYSEYAYVTHINDATVKPRSYTIHTSPEQSVISDTDTEYMEILPPQSSCKASDEDSQEEDDDDYVLPVYVKSGRIASDTDAQQGRNHGDSGKDSNLSKQKSRSIDGKFLHRVESHNLPLKERSSSVAGNNMIVHPGPTDSYTNDTHRWMSTSVPDLLSVDHKPSNGENGLSIETPLLHRVSMASSTDSSNSAASTTSNVKHKKKRLGNLFKKKKTKPVILDEGKPPLAAESDPGKLPGYFPGISKQDAFKMLGGQSHGSYVIYTDYSSGNFVFKIEVSKGEGVKPLSITIESILLANGETGLGITVPGHHGNTTSSQLFHNLETLVSYYSTHSIIPDGRLCLSSPLKASKGKQQDKVKKKKPVPFPVITN